MNKELISEINRFREIVGLNVINEAPLGISPVYKALERFFDKFGVSTLEDAELKSLESALSKDANLVRDFDEIGTKLSNAATSAEGERLLDTYLRQLPNFKLVVNILEKNAPDVFQDVVNKTFESKMNPAFYDAFEEAYEKQGTKGVLDLYNVAVPSNQSERLKFMLGKWKPEPKVKGGGGTSGGGTSGGGTSGGGTSGGGKLSVSSDAEVLFNAKNIGSVLTNDEIKLINDLATKIGDIGIDKLTPMERIKLESTLQKVNSSIDIAIEKLKKQAEQMTGAEKINVEKRIVWWENFKKQSKSFVGIKAMLSYASVALGLFAAYIGIGFISALCDLPLVSFFCSSAKKKMRDFKPDETKPEETKPEETKPEEGGDLNKLSP
jgi:hypothetical protein